MKRALIIAAHPDDEILGCGGLISKYEPLGILFKVVFIGEGSTCRFQDPTSEPAISAIRQRNSAAKEALTFLNVVDYSFHDLPCGRFDQVPIISINKIIEREIFEFGPDTVFTHSPYDANSDHKIVFNSTIMATRPTASNHVHRLLSYEVLSTSEWAFINTFTPNYFEALSEIEVEKKWRALTLYESEVKSYPFPRSNEGIRALAMIRGMQAGLMYAEAFHLIREFKQ
jgi:LmbE family N-acetylglucosaminyl deacetylase